jgi:crooked neck
VQPVQKIADEEELAEYRLLKRISFENAVRRNRTAIGAWLKYAQWEEQQDEIERARSLYERALEHEHRNETLWLKYSEMEMRRKNVNRARNILDRVVAILPRVDLFWYKYTYMEELLDNPAGARQVFERWMKWEPTEEAWMAYVKFETRYVFLTWLVSQLRVYNRTDQSPVRHILTFRYKELDRARQIFNRFVSCYPLPKNWIKYARFEEQHQNIETAREIYTQCIQTLGEEYIDQNVYISFAKFETRCKEIERSRTIYQYALERLLEGEKENLYNVYTQFEKQYGTKDGLEDVIVSKRRLKYEEELMKNEYNYDIWFDYIRLEEGVGKPEKVREVYERAISKVPLVEEKRYWRRYIYLWVYYAVWEELEAEVI